MLDVSLNEDPSRFRTDNAAEKLATLRKIALNCLRKESESPQKSIHAKRLLAALNEDYLSKLLRTALSANALTDTEHALDAILCLV